MEVEEERGERGVRHRVCVVRPLPSLPPSLLQSFPLSYTHSVLQSLAPSPSLYLPLSPPQPPSPSPRPFLPPPFPLSHLYL